MGASQGWGIFFLRIALQGLLLSICLPVALDFYKKIKTRRQRAKASIDVVSLFITATNLLPVGLPGKVAMKMDDALHDIRMARDKVNGLLPILYLNLDGNALDIVSSLNSIYMRMLDYLENYLVVRKRGVSSSLNREMAEAGLHIDGLLMRLREYAKKVNNIDIDKQMNTFSHEHLKLVFEAVEAATP